MIELITFCVVAVTKHHLGWGNWIWWLYGVCFLLSLLLSAMPSKDRL